MTCNVVMRDLFTVSEDYYLVHCISADLGMGAGIAIQFNKHFDMRNKLLRQFGASLVTAWDKDSKGFCIHEDRVFNLITKRNYWLKPTYETLEQALMECKNQCVFLNINKLAMPQIGCGLDRLEWCKVAAIIQSVFSDTDIEILVCKL